MNTLVDHMSWDTYTRKRDDIDTQVETILNSKIRKQFRIAALYEKRSGTLMAEVLRTTHGPVVVHRIPHHWAHGAPDYNLLLRAGRGRLIAPLTGEPDQKLYVFGRSRLYLITGTEFINRAAADKQVVFR